MFRKIIVPVDLDHLDELSRALTVAANIAKISGGEVIFLGVHASAPSPEDQASIRYSAKLDDFAAAQAKAHSITASGVAVLGKTQLVDIGPAVVAAARDNEADLVVMASHVPGWAEHIFHSNAGYVACHAEASVFVVR